MLAVAIMTNKPTKKPLLKRAWTNQLLKSQLKKMKITAARAFPRLLALRETSLPRAAQAKAILSTPYVQALMEDSSTIDPEERHGPEEEQALVRLRQALTKATGIELYGSMTDEDLDKQRGAISSDKRRDAEVRAVKKFQEKPGPVRRRMGDFVQLEHLKGLTKTGVYDPPTILALAKVEMSAEIPPGAREYAGRSGTPWLMRSKVGADKAAAAQKSGGAGFEGYDDIWGGSVLVKVEGSRHGSAKWRSRIDGLLSELDEHLGISS